MKENSKIEELKTRNAKNMILKKFDFLGIKNIFSSLDERGEHLFVKYRETGIYRYDNEAVAKFPFHHNGVIDNDLEKQTNQKARAVFKEKLLNFVPKTEPYTYILLSAENKGFWVEVDLNKIYENLEKIWQEYGDFVVFSEDFFALDIHQAEYEWEVLQWQNLENKN